jgi:hypothetical protein
MKVAAPEAQALPENSELVRGGRQDASPHNWSELSRDSIGISIAPTLVSPPIFIMESLRWNICLWSWPSLLPDSFSPA